MNLILFLLLVAGVTRLLVYSKIFSEVRNFFSNLDDGIKYLVHCPQCVGFYVGLFLYLLFMDKMAIMGLWWADCVLFGLISSLVSYVAGVGIGDDGFRIERKEIVIQNNNSARPRIVKVVKGKEHEKKCLTKNCKKK